MITEGVTWHPSAIAPPRDRRLRAWWETRQHQHADNVRAMRAVHAASLRDRQASDDESARKDGTATPGQG